MVYFDVTRNISVLRYARIKNKDTDTKKFLMFVVYLTPPYSLYNRDYMF